MVVATTVAGLGTPDTDGELGIIRLGSGEATVEEHIYWNDAQGAWVGRPHTAMRQMGTWPSQQNGNPSAWTYPFAGPTDHGYGFQIHHVKGARALYDAGLRLQERLTAWIHSSDTGPPLVALNWYGLNEDSGFLSPDATNQGVNLIGDVSQDQYSDGRWFSTGWQNTPMTAPTEANWYPEVYVKGSSSFQFKQLHAQYRWVAGTLGATGGGDDSRDQPVVVNPRWHHYIAEEIPRADGAAVADWQDLSGFGGSLYQSSGSLQPLLVRNNLNGLAVVRFDGVDDYLQLANVGGNFSLAQPITIMAVLKQYSGGSDPQVWLSGVTGPPLMYRNANDGTLNMWGSAAEISGDSGSWGGWGVYTFTLNGASSSVHNNLTEVVAGDASGSGLAGLKVGVRGSDNGLAAHIDVAEVLVYYSALNQTDREAMVNALMDKYNL